MGEDVPIPQIHVIMDTDFDFNSGLGHVKLNGSLAAAGNGNSFMPGRCRLGSSLIQRRPGVRFLKFIFTEFDRFSQHQHHLLGAGVLGHGFGSFGDGVLGQLARKEEPHSGLDLPGGDGGPLVVVSQPG